MLNHNQFLLSIVSYSFYLLLSLCCLYVRLKESPFKNIMLCYCILFSINTEKKCCQQTRGRRQGGPRNTENHVGIRSKKTAITHRDLRKYRNCSYKSAWCRQQYFSFAIPLEIRIWCLQLKHSKPLKCCKKRAFHYCLFFFCKNSSRCFF